MTIEEKKRTQLIQKTLQAVVSISVQERRLRGAPDEKSIADSALDSGGGSGFIAHPSGIVITNTHVIRNTDLRHTVTTNADKTYPAKILGTDDIHDVAFLKIESDEKFPAVQLGDSSSVVLGQNVYAIGNVLGYFKNTVSSGIISGLTRSIEAMNEDRKEELHGLIQTDAAINPGNSGGPLMDSSGKVIGINSAAVAAAENIAFAIPINTIKNNLSDILKYGKIRRAYFGVRHIFINERIQRAFELPLSYGIWIMSPAKQSRAVIPHSPAAQAGIKEKDIIFEIDGKKLSEEYTLEEFLEDAKGGQRVVLGVMRKNRKLRIEAVLVEKK